MLLGAFVGGWRLNRKKKKKKKRERESAMRSKKKKRKGTDPLPDCRWQPPGEKKKKKRRRDRTGGKRRGRRPNRFSFLAEGAHSTMGEKRERHHRTKRRRERGARTRSLVRILLTLDFLEEEKRGGAPGRFR